MAKATEYQKTIKRMNERIADIGRTYGQENYYYQLYEEKIRAYLSDTPEAIRTSKTGNIAISTSEKFKDNEGMEALLRQMESIPTKGEIHADIRKKYGEYLPEGEMREIVEMNSDISNFMKTHKAGEKYESAEIKEFFRATGRRENTIEEQKKFVEEWMSMEEDEMVSLPNYNPWESEKN